MKKLKSTMRSPIMIVIGIVLCLYIVFLFTLIFWGFFTAVKATSGTFNTYRGNEFGMPEGAPWQWEWGNYAYVMEWMNVKKNVTINGVRFQIEKTIGDMFGNTLLYTFGGAAVSTLVPLFVAYATTRTDFKFSKIFDAVILVVMIIPIVGAYPSELQLLNELGIYDTWFGYYIQRSHCISAYYLIFQAQFRAVPKSYSEAAYIDGAGEYAVMFKVVLPLVRTVAMTVFLIFFISIWNDYNTALLYMPTHPSLAYGVFHLVMNGNNKISKVPYKMAGVFMLFTPILIMFICLQKVLMQNLSMGGLKE